jgi:hypothetical protein
MYTHFHDLGNALSDIYSVAGVERERSSAVAIQVMARAVPTVAVPATPTASSFE